MLLFYIMSSPEMVTFFVEELLNFRFSIQILTRTRPGRYPDGAVIAGYSHCCDIARGFNIVVIRLSKRMPVISFSSIIINFELLF